MNAEAELAARVLAWLHAEQWETWSEVQPSAGGGICDIVAKRGPVVWAIEAKVRPTMEVLEQAARWSERAHYVSVAVPARRNTCTFQRFARLIGVGVLWVREIGVDDNRGPYSRICERWSRPLLDYLTPERQAWPSVAGSNRAERFSAFAWFCREVREAVVKQPGATAREIIAVVRDHHYSNDASARSCLISWARAGKVPGVVVSYRGRTPVLYPEGFPLALVPEQVELPEMPTLEQLGLGDLVP